MLDQIIKFRKKGLSFRKIAKELNTTVGKVQYQWVKYQKSIESVKSQEEKETTTATVSKRRKAIIKHQAKLSKNEITDSHFYLLFSSNNRAFGYWEIDQTKLNEICKKFDVNQSNLTFVIRLYDITSIEFNGHNHHHFVDMLIPNTTTEWFINGLKENRTYCAEIGVLLPNERLFSIVRSNVIHTPRTNTTQEFHSLQSLAEFEHGRLKEPRWVEHVSTYSYYVKNMGEKI